MRKLGALDLAARTLAAIRRDEELNEGRIGYERVAADRERVASDLAGLLAHQPEPGGWSTWQTPHEYVACSGCGCMCSDRYDDGPEWPCPDARLYASGLARTAALYAVAA